MTTQEKQARAIVREKLSDSKWIKVALLADLVVHIERQRKVIRRLRAALKDAK